VSKLQSLFSSRIENAEILGRPYYGSAGKGAFASVIE
jgi:hypothetical protein